MIYAWHSDWEIKEQTERSFRIRNKNQSKPRTVEWKGKPVSTGIFHLMVPAARREAVANARPDLGAVGDVLHKAGGDAFYLFAADEDGAKARLFDATHGIGEDPATGSAAGPLGCFLVHHGARSPGRSPGRRHVAAQGERRAVVRQRCAGRRDLERRELAPRPIVEHDEVVGHQLCLARRVLLAHVRQCLAIDRL